jgi:hypothetical protein
MEKEFVSYEIALALKELGFDEPCFGGWDKDRGWWYHPDSDIIVDAPLKQQAFDYFRNKYNLIYQINYLYNGNYQVIIHKNTHEYMEIIESKYGRNSCVYEIPDNYSYEEAESACIDKLIEIVKEKINHEA